MIKFIKCGYCGSKVSTKEALECVCQSVKKNWIYQMNVMNMRNYNMQKIKRKLEIERVMLDEASDFTAKYHRHSKPLKRHRIYDWSH